VNSLRSHIHRWLRLSPRELRVVLLVCGLFVLSALAYVWPNVRMVLLAYEFQKQQRTHQTLVKENAMLQVERDSLMALGRIRALSQTQLGMQPPKAEQVVTVFLK